MDLRPPEPGRLLDGYLHMTNSEEIYLGPPRDRRAGRRILTLKNLYISLLVGALVLALVSISSEWRREPAGTYGRLYSSRTLPAAPPVPKPEVIREQEIPEQATADPMLVNTLPKEQYLGVVRPLPTAAIATPAAIETPAATAGSTSFAAPEEPAVSAVRDGERLVLTGGPDGVRLDVKKEQ